MQIEPTGAGPLASRLLDNIGGFLVEPTSNAVTILSVLSVVMGGLWVWRDSRLRDKYFPKIEFLVDVLFKAEHDDKWIVEIVCALRNRGLVRFRASDIQFDLRGISPEDGDDQSRADINHQTYFPHELKEGPWYARRDETFVEAGTSQVYRHITTIPKSMTAVLLHGKMKYKAKINGRPVQHSSDRLVRVPHNLDEAEKYLDGEKLRNFLNGTMIEDHGNHGE